MEEMENMKGYKAEVEKLQNIIEHLESGDLAIEQLIELEEVTRNLHEKSIILRYKAFENQVLGEIEEEGGIEQIVIKEEVKVEPEIDFSLFGESVEGEKETPIFEPFAEPEVKEESIIEITEESTENIVEVVADVVEEPSVPSIVEEKKEKPTFGTQFTAQDNSIAAQFSGSKLDTLIGAFGINQRLGFINNLFDGSSDNFSSAIKDLDSKDSLEVANSVLIELSKKYDWEMEDEDVSEFQSYVNRRYA